MITPELHGGKTTKLVFTILLGLTTAAFTGQALAQGGTWATKTSMLTARGGFATSVVNGVIYTVGGQNSSENSGMGTVEAYDPGSNTWTTKASMSTARVFLGTTVVNGILYAI